MVVVSAEEATMSAATSVAELLETVPGIDVQSRGAFGIQTDLSVRGGTFEQTALWVDGVRWSAPQTGHHLMDLPVDAEDISRIEVVRGGASSILGTGAMTGAVALTAGPGMQDGTLLVAETGTNAWMRAKVTHDFGSDLSTAEGTVARHRISLSRMGTHGTLGAQTNTDANAIRARYAGWLLAIGVQFGPAWGTRARRLAPKISTQTRAIRSTKKPRSSKAKRCTKRSWAPPRWKRQSTTAPTRTSTSCTETTRIITSSNEDSTVFASSSAEAPSWYIGFGPNQGITHLMGGRAKAELRGTLGQTFVAMDTRREFIKSNRLGVDSLGDEEGVYTLGDVRLNTDVALGHRFSKGRLALSAIAAWNHNTMFDSLQFVPSGDVSVDLTGDGKNLLFAAASRSVRSPSYTELYYPVPGTVGDRDLLVESSEMVEAGIRLTLVDDGLYNVQFEQSLYRRTGQNLIDFVRPDTTTTTYAVNLDGVSFKGFETVLNITSTEATRTTCSCATPVLVSPPMEASKASSGFELYVLDGLESKMDFSVGITVPGDLRLDMRLSRQDRLGGYRDFDTGAEVDFEPFSIASCTASRMFADNQIRAFVRVDNDEQVVSGHWRCGTARALVPHGICLPNEVSLPDLCTMAEVNDAPDMRRLVAGLGQQMEEALKLSLWPMRRSMWVSIVAWWSWAWEEAALVVLSWPTCCGPLARFRFKRCLTKCFRDGWMRRAWWWRRAILETRKRPWRPWTRQNQEGCTIAAVTSGGHLAKRAAQGGWPVVTMPGGNPPRSHLAALFGPLCADACHGGVVQSLVGRPSNGGRKTSMDHRLRSEARRLLLLWKARTFTSTETRPCVACSPVGGSN